MWSPDGQSLAFVAGADREHFDVYIMGIDGSRPINITNSQQPEYDVAWSPDGEYIAFSRDIIVEASGGIRMKKSEIWLVQPNGTNARKITDGCCMRWLPTSRDLVYLVSDVSSGLSDLWLIGADGSSPLNITNSPLREQAATVSADGRFIAYSAFDDSSQRSHLYLFDRRESSTIDLTPDFENAGSPAFSPNGTRIAFRGSNSGVGVWLYVINTDGTKLANLSQLSRKPEEANDGEPLWISDSMLVFISDRDRSADLYALNSDGTDLRKLLSASSVHQGAGFVSLSAWP